MQYVSYANVHKILIIKFCKEIPKSSRLGLGSDTLLPFFITWHPRLHNDRYLPTLTGYQNYMLCSHHTMVWLNSLCPSRKWLIVTSMLSTSPYLVFALHEAYLLCFSLPQPNKIQNKPAHARFTWHRWSIVMWVMREILIWLINFKSDWCEKIVNSVVVFSLNKKILRGKLQNHCFSPPFTTLKCVSGT